MFCLKFKILFFKSGCFCMLQAPHEIKLPKSVDVATHNSKSLTAPSVSPSPLNTDAGARFSWVTKLAVLFSRSQRISFSHSISIEAV
jgi:hypothetical protein